MNNLDSVFLLFRNQPRLLYAWHYHLTKKLMRSAELLKYIGKKQFLNLNILKILKNKGEV